MDALFLVDRDALRARERPLGIVTAILREGAAVRTR